jgi:hypothetical protein
LLPGKDNDAVEIKWRVVSLDSPPPYEALSYTWGSGSETEIVRLDNLEAFVRPNLNSVLRRIRKDTEVRFLWVDALCIDQRNVIERNAQVARMRDIFAKAEQVFAWLGDEADDSDLAMGYNGLELEHSPGTSDVWAREVLPYWQAFASILQRPW